MRQRRTLCTNKRGNTSKRNNNYQATCTQCQISNKNKIDKPLTNLTKMRKEKTQMSKIRSEKKKIATNTMEIQGIIRDYFDNLFTNKL
jgi:hypothetical protein